MDKEAQKPKEITGEVKKGREPYTDFELWFLEAWEQDREKFRLEQERERHQSEQSGL